MTVSQGKNRCSAVISVGDELLIGQVVNTNASWLGEQLENAGYPVRELTAIGDEFEIISKTLERFRKSVDVLIITGGLGPTHDDLTREAVADALGITLHTDKDVLDHLTTYFRERRRRMTEGSEKMAEVPDGFEVLPNPVGTAPGLWYNDKKSKTIIVLLPGVPREMRAIVRDSVVPRLTEAGGRVARYMTLLVAGEGESIISERLSPLSSVLEDGVKLAFLPSAKRGVRLRLSVERGCSDPQRALEKSAHNIRARLGKLIFGVGSQKLEEVVGELLSHQHRTLGIGESCTGGMISDRLTNTPGSSAYLMGSAVTYSNASKTALLNVSEEILHEFGAVSEQVVRLMAEGARALYQATDGLASTGIAGPSGGTAEKPVGTVWIAHASEAGTVARKLSLTKDRIVNKELTATMAINLLRLRLME